MKYAYQIQGLLEGKNKRIMGFRVFITSSEYFDTVDVPAEIFSTELLAYLKYRSAVCSHFDIRKLPATLQSDIRNPMNAWLDNWVAHEYKGLDGDFH